MLEVDNIHFYYGRIHALQGVTLEVPAGKVVCLIGSNGAGKSTTLMSISAVNPVTRGEIRYEGKPIHALSPEEIVRLGICQVPEGRRIFPALTVLENLDMGAFLRKDAAEVSQDLDHVYSLFPILYERRRQRGGTLSGGEQQRAAIARALVNDPPILLADEPTGNLDPDLSVEIMQMLIEVQRRGTTVVVATHDRSLMDRFGRRVVLLNKGFLIEDGAPVEVLPGAPGQLDGLDEFGP